MHNYLLSKLSQILRKYRARELKLNGYIGYLIGPWIFFQNVGIMKATY